MLIYWIFFMLSPPFRSIDTLLSIFTQASILAVLASGTTVVLISGGLAVILEVSKLNFAQSSRGQSYELFAIAAVVIGGTSLFGGRGGVGKTIIGMLIIQTIYLGFAYLGVGTSIQRIAIGFIIILAVYWDVWQLGTR